MNNDSPALSTSAQNPGVEPMSYNAWREEFILTLLRIASFLGIGFIILSSVQSTPLRNLIIPSSFLILLLAVTFLRVAYTLRAYTLLLITFAVGINGVITHGTWTNAGIFLVALVVLASILFDSFENVVVFGITFLALCIFAFLQNFGSFKPTSPISPETSILDWATYIAYFTVSSIVSMAAIGQLKQGVGRVIQQFQNALESAISERTQLENKVQERTEELESKTNQLRTSTSIARNIVEIQNIPDLLETSVATVANQFGYYHVGIYLLDTSRKNAFLQASSSAFGTELIGLGHRVDADIRNPINIAIEQGRAYATSDSGGTVFTKDSNFPATRTRIAAPLLVRGNIFGVLDMHSERVRSLNDQDLEVVQALADLIAISIDNVRLIDETQTLVEQLKFFNSTQALETWTKHTARRAPAYQYTPAGVRPIFAQSRKEDADPGTLLIPLALQGQKIGTIKLRRKGFSVAWSEKEKGMVEKIGEQISLALENSRLVDEAQKNAQRDQLIANISSRVRETLDVDAVIRTASTELRKVFDLKEAEISIGLPQAEPRPVRKNTSTLRLK